MRGLFFARLVPASSRTQEVSLTWIRIVVSLVRLVSWFMLRTCPSFTIRARSVHKTVALGRYVSRRPNPYCFPSHPPSGPFFRICCDHSLTVGMSAAGTLDRRRLAPIWVPASILLSLHFSADWFRRHASRSSSCMRSCHWRPSSRCTLFRSLSALCMVAHRPHTAHIPRKGRS